MPTQLFDKGVLSFSCNKDLSYGDRFLISETPSRQGNDWITKIFLSSGEEEEIFLPTEDVSADYYIVIRGHKNGDPGYSYDALSVNKMMDISNAIEAEIYELINSAARQD